jgi:hypothetical protein
MTRCSSKPAATIRKPNLNSTPAIDCSDILTVNFCLASVEEYERQSALLNNRFDSTRTIAGMHHLHSFCQISSDKLKVKDFSSSEEKRIECVITFTSNATNNVTNIVTNTGYITAVYDHSWWLA